MAYYQTNGVTLEKEGKVVVVTLAEYQDVECDSPTGRSFTVKFDPDHESFVGDAVPKLLAMRNAADAEQARVDSITAQINNYLDNKDV